MSCGSWLGWKDGDLAMRETGVGDERFQGSGERTANGSTAYAREMGLTDDRYVSEGHGMRRNGWTDGSELEVMCIWNG